MARRAKPWFRKARGAWFVTVEGVQHNLGADKNESFERFYQLMRQPQRFCDQYPDLRTTDLKPFHVQ